VPIEAGLGDPARSGKTRAGRRAPGTGRPTADTDTGLAPLTTSLRIAIDNGSDVRLDALTRTEIARSGLRTPSTNRLWMIGSASMAMVASSGCGTVTPVGPPMDSSWSGLVPNSEERHHKQQVIGRDAAKGSSDRPPQTARVAVVADSSPVRAYGHGSPLCQDVARSVVLSLLSAGSGSDFSEEPAWG
jgi:hypothetical protein